MLTEYKQYASFRFYTDVIRSDQHKITNDDKEKSNKVIKKLITKIKLQN